MTDSPLKPMFDEIDAESRLVAVVDAFYSGATHDQIDPVVKGGEFEDAVRTNGAVLADFPGIYQQLLTLKTTGVATIKGEL